MSDPTGPSLNRFTDARTCFAEADAIAAAGWGRAWSKVESIIAEFGAQPVEALKILSEYAGLATHGSDVTPGRLTPVERFAAECLEQGFTHVLAIAARLGFAEPDCAKGGNSPSAAGRELLARLKAAREDEEIASLRARLQTLESQRRTRA